MKAPSSLELLGIQSTEDYYLSQKSYPDWWKLPLEKRVTSDGETHQNRIDKSGRLWKLELFLISVIASSFLLVGYLIFGLFA